MLQPLISARRIMTITHLERIAFLMHDLGFTGICIDSQDSGEHVVHGIRVGDHFFPIWELGDDIENLAFLVNGMFTDILAKRPSNWDAFRPPPIKCAECERLKREYIEALCA